MTITLQLRHYMVQATFKHSLKAARDTTYKTNKQIQKAFNMLQPVQHKLLVYTVTVHIMKNQEAALYINNGTPQTNRY